MMILKNVNSQITLAALILTFVGTSCQKLNFTQLDETSKMSIDIPDDDAISEPTPVTPPPAPTPKPVITRGACSADSSTLLTSCLKCNIPQNPPPAPQFSQKGQSLIDIMSLACSVPNKSAPKNYVAPTYEQLVQRLNQLTPVFYPDSKMSSLQISVVQGLKADANLLKKMFGGLWYQPPYSDAFETYFGLEVGEAVMQLCYKSDNSVFTPYNTTNLQSKQFIDCQYESSSFSCKESATYVQSNVYRNQLRRGMIESITNPYVDNSVQLPTKTCAWEKFTGLYSEGGAEQLGLWLVNNQKVSLEVLGEGARCANIKEIPSGVNVPQGQVIMSTYVCK